VLILPIALPGWAIEYLVHSRRPGWEFSTFTSLPYFLILFALATIGVVYLPLPLLGSLSTQMTRHSFWQLGLVLQLLRDGGHVSAPA
jgi:hypothetical protein